MTNDFDPKTIRKQLNALRIKHGDDTPIGHRCSNLIEQFDNLPPGPDERIEYLTPDWMIKQRADLLKGIEKQLAGLSRFMGTGAIQ